VPALRIADDDFPQALQARGLSAADKFRARCEARAILYAAGELNLHEAVDALQADAVASGLVDEIGQDAVQQIMADSFRGVRP
jgi:hypothetical protein